MSQLSYGHMAALSFLIFPESQGRAHGVSKLSKEAGLVVLVLPSSVLGLVTRLLHL